MITKKSYVGLLLILHGVIFSAVCMEEKSMQDIFEPFTHQKFSQDDMMHFLVASKAGRHLLLGMRMGELLIENTFNSLTTSILCADSFLYGRDIAVVVYPPKSKQDVILKGRPITFVSTGVSAIEKCLLENTNLPLSTVVKLENTRVHDLYLLKKTLENDNNKDIKKIDPYYTLLGILFSTHQSWPPKNYSSQVNATSGFTVMRKILEYRKSHDIDNQDDSNYKEDFTCKGYQATGQEDAQEN